MQASITELARKAADKQLVERLASQADARKTFEDALEKFRNNIGFDFDECDDHTDVPPGPKSNSNHCDAMLVSATSLDSRILRTQIVATLATATEL